jgi:hypothetical protein
MYLIRIEPQLETKNKARELRSQDPPRRILRSIVSDARACDWLMTSGTRASPESMSYSAQCPDHVSPWGLSDYIVLNDVSVGPREGHVIASRL